MGFWFGTKLHEQSIDITPRQKILHGEYKTYKDAKNAKKQFISPDFLKTDIFEASTEEDAQSELESQKFLRF